MSDDVAQAVESSAHPPLFPDEMFPGEVEVVDASTPDVNTFRRAFRALAWYKKMIAAAEGDEKRVMEAIAKETANVQDFYARKRSSAEGRMDYWKGQLDAMMRQLTVTRFATPYGTSFYKKTKKKEWLMDDAQLLEFAKSTNHGADLIRVKEYPDKKQIETYVESTGVEGVLSITEKEEVQFRLKDTE